MHANILECAGGRGSVQLLEDTCDCYGSCLLSQRRQVSAYKPGGGFGNAVEVKVP